MENRTTLNKINVYAFPSKQAFLQTVSSLKKILIAVNAEKILKDDNPKLISIINNNVGYTDGIGAVLAVRQKGLKAVKLPGVELWLDILIFSGAAKSFYFIGSTQEVIEATVKKLKISFPGICIAGWRNGFIKTEDEKENLIKDILVKKPDVVFVAMGSPKQEYLMDEMYQRYRALYMGLGGSFDIYSGIKKRAPKIFLVLGIEWLYRLLKEPTRVKRQLVLVKFFWFLLLRKL